MQKLFTTLLLLTAISFTTLAQAQQTLILGAYNETAAPGEEICVDIYGRQFLNILSMQYTLKWDADVLEFTGVKGFNLEGLSKENFGYHRTADGLLTFAWYEPYLRGISLQEGATLYQVCFKVKAKAETQTTLEFTSEPTEIEIANSASEFLDLQGEGGVIRVKG